MTSDLDTGMRRKFDLDCGYAALNEASCNAMQRSILDGQFELVENGIEKVRALSEEDCAKIRAFMDVGGEAREQRDAKVLVLEQLSKGAGSGPR